MKLATAKDRYLRNWMKIEGRAENCNVMKRVGKRCDLPSIFIQFLRYRSLAVANFIGAGYKELLDCEDLRCLQSESADELIHVQDTLLLPL